MKNLICILLFTPIILIGQEYLTYNHNGINRDYVYYEPVGLSDNAPLVFVAHGYSDSHTSIMNYSGMNVIANQNGFAVCYPKGTTENEWGGQNFWNVGYDFHEGYSVNDIDFLINFFIIVASLRITFPSVYSIDERIWRICLCCLT